MTERAFDCEASLEERVYKFILDGGECPEINSENALAFQAGLVRFRCEEDELAPDIRTSAKRREIVIGYSLDNIFSAQLELPDRAVLEVFLAEVRRSGEIYLPPPHFDPTAKRFHDPDKFVGNVSPVRQVW